MSQQIEQLKPSIVNELKAEFSGEIQAVKKIASDALDLALSNEDKIRSMKEDILDLRIVCSRVTEENGRLRLQCDRQESYSRKDNLIIRGLTEEQDETEEKCIKKIKNFLINNLSLEELTGFRVL